MACDYTGPYGTFADPVTGSTFGVAREERGGPHGSYPVVTLLTPDGQSFAVIPTEVTLKQALDPLPEPGDWLLIRFVEWRQSARTGSAYRVYRVRIKRGGAEAAGPPGPDTAA